MIKPVRQSVLHGFDPSKQRLNVSKKGRLVVEEKTWKTALMSLIGLGRPNADKVAELVSRELVKDTSLHENKHLQVYVVSLSPKLSQDTRDQIARVYTSCINTLGTAPLTDRYFDRMSHFDALHNRPSARKQMDHLIKQVTTHSRAHIAHLEKRADLSPVQRAYLMAASRFLDGVEKHSSTPQKLVDFLSSERGGAMSLTQSSAKLHKELAHASDRDFLDLDQRLGHIEAIRTAVRKLGGKESFKVSDFEKVRQVSVKPFKGTSQ